MNPYYANEHVTLYHGDCREVTAWLEADVLVTDPPYGMNFVSNRRRAGRLADITGDEDTSMRDEIVSLWGAERPALVFGRWSVAAPAGEKQRLIWHKAATQGMGDLRMPWGPNFEDIHVLGGGWDREATGMPRTGAVITTTQAVGGRRSGERHRAPYAQAGWAHGTAHREVPAGHDRRPIRGIRRHAHSRTESRPPLYRRGNRGALLRGHRTAPLRAGHGPLGRR